MHTLRTCEIYRDSTSAIFVVESLESRRYELQNCLQVYGSISPLAVIVCGQEVTTAFDMEAKPADLEKLRDVLAELDDTIGTWRQTKQSE